jgi:hypothetical protein
MHVKVLIWGFEEPMVENRAYGPVMISQELIDFIYS